MENPGKYYLNCLLIRRIPGSGHAKQFIGPRTLRISLQTGTRDSSNCFPENESSKVDRDCTLTVYHQKTSKLNISLRLSSLNKMNLFIDELFLSMNF